MKLPKISYFLHDNGACGIYRLANPMTAIEQNKKAQVMWYEKGDDADKIALCLEADLMVIPRPYKENWINAFKQLQNGGKKIVIDFDDDMFDINPTNPAYSEFGTKMVTVEVGGKKYTPWIDGENINFKENQKKLDICKRACEMADMITVTTPLLADVYKQFNNNVVDLPNCLDMQLWERLPIENDGIRLIWAGGGSHFLDWLLLKDALPVIMEKYRKVKFVMFGSTFPAMLDGLPKDRVERHEWVHTRAYPYKMAILNPDIALIPLQANLFNSCKSIIKWVEMSSLNVPCVISYVSPYADYVPENTAIFAENETDAWIEAISALIENSILMSKISGEAERYVRVEYDINSQYIKWFDAYEPLLKEAA